MENIVTYIPAAAFIIIVLTALVELLLRATWTDWYFKAGIPLIVRNIQVDSHYTTIPDQYVLETRFRSRWFDLTRSLMFKKIGENMYGFRESLLARSLSLLHGVVIFDDHNSQVVVKGFFSWTMFSFWLLWLVIPPLLWLLSSVPVYEPSLLEVLSYLGILVANVGISFWINYVRGSAVAEFAAQSWSRKYVPANRG